VIGNSEEMMLVQLNQRWKAEYAAVGFGEDPQRLCVRDANQQAQFARVDGGSDRE